MLVILLISCACVWLFPISAALSTRRTSSAFVHHNIIANHQPQITNKRTKHINLSVIESDYNDPESDEKVYKVVGDQSTHQSSLDVTSAKTRRQFFQQQIIATSTTIFPTITHAASSSSTTDLVNNNGYFSLRNNNNVPSYTPQRKRQLTQQQIQKKDRAAETRKKATSFPTKTKKWTPFVNVNKWNSVETCLLEMLPVTNSVFRHLQDLIQDLQVYSPGDSDGWKQTLFDLIGILSVLDTKRSALEPVFNQEDSTELYISKSSIGESNIENLRSKLEELIDIASGDIDIDMNTEDSSSTVNSVTKKKGVGRRRENKKIKDNNGMEYINMDEAGDIDADAFRAKKREALLVLSELGELLVPSFPYAVPTRGKFGYLPRLLGRCQVTLSFERPSTASTAFGINIGGSDKQFLGNVTIIADGYAAPITAGNFVDLSNRNFYTGLDVKAMRKRLGVIPTWSDNVIVNDLTELKYNLDELGASALEIPEALNKNARDQGFSGIFRPIDDPYAESLYDESRTTTAVLKILGSFQEGFYDPLTAKPRRIPLELVTLDSASPTKSTLTYSSTYAALDDNMAAAGTTTYSDVVSSSSAQRSFSSATSESSSNTTTGIPSNLDPVLSFNIPDLVALNHPDRLSNGGSSEFFALPRRDASSRRAQLLDGQYAPFGYIGKNDNAVRLFTNSCLVVVLLSLSRWHGNFHC